MKAELHGEDFFAFPDICGLIISYLFSHTFINALLAKGQKEERKIYKGIGNTNTINAYILLVLKNGVGSYQPQGGVDSSIGSLNDLHGSL